MTKVDVRPLPEAYRPFKRFRPMPPPIFPDGDPSPDDIVLARELFKALDQESQRWYRSIDIFADQLPG